MEMLSVAAHHRNQSYARNTSQIADQFGTSPLRGFKGVNCRTFESGASILSSPPSISPTFPSTREPKSPRVYSEPPKTVKLSKPIAITPKPSCKSCKAAKDASFTDELSFSELWAGPAYSNSPPPSSLPIPKFSLRQKRSVSLELPISKPEVADRPVAKSAPSSPTRVSSQPMPDFFVSTASATETLRRILHLDD